MRRLVALAAILLATLAVAACGSSKSASPAELAPAGSVFYGEAALKPEGDQKAALDALARKFPGERDAGSLTRELVDRALRESKTGLTYERDVQPWVGDTAGFFGAGVDRRGQLAGVGVILAAEDESKAEEAVEKAAKGKSTDASYRDFDYKRIRGGGAAGVVNGNLVAGTERGFRAVADATEGDGRPIQDSEAYEKALEGAPEDRLAHLYFNTARFVDAARNTAGGAAIAPLARLFRDPYVATVDADADGLEFAATLPESLSSLFLPLLGKGSDLIEQLPGDSWAAAGQPELGKTLERYVDVFASSVGGRDVIEQQLRKSTGLDLERDVTGWMKDFGLFVRGTTTATVNGALVIETSDEQASERALKALERQLGRSGDARVGRLTAPGGGEGFTVRDEDSPEPVHVFQRGDKVVAAYGDEAAKDAIEAGGSLGDTPSFKAAAGSLGAGYEVSTYVATAPIVELADSSGGASNADWQRAKPYLEAFDALIGGTKEEGGNLVSKVRLTVP